MSCSCTTDDPTSPVRLVFRLDDRTGLLKGEGVWADDFGRDRYRLWNIPFHADEYAYHDIVLAGRARDGLLTVRRLVNRSGHATAFLLTGDEPMASATYRRCRERLQDVGCQVGAGPSSVVNVLPQAERSAVLEALENGRAAGAWHYQLGACWQSSPIQPERRGRS